MITVLMEMAAAEHRTDLRRAAQRSWSSAELGQPQTPRDAAQTPRIELRDARPGDAGALLHLAELDEASPLTGPVLLASADGRPIAALSLADRRVVADPFVATAHAVSLLRARADQVTNARGHRRLRWRLPRLRLA